MRTDSSAVLSPPSGVRACPRMLTARRVAPPGVTMLIFQAGPAGRLRDVIATRAAGCGPESSFCTAAASPLTDPRTEQSPRGNPVADVPDQLDASWKAP